MIQRFIKKALDVGIASYVQQGLPAYQELFGDVWYLSSTEVAGISNYFGKYPMQTHLGYPRAALSPNNVSIYIIEASQAQPGFAVGDQGTGGGAVVTPSGQIVAGTPMVSSLWDHILNVMVFSFNHETTVYGVEICKSILLAAKQYFISLAVELPVMSISEVQPAQEYEPENLWMRNLSLRCRREFSIANTSDALQRAFKVAGVSAQPGSPNPAGDVLSLLGVDLPATSS